LKRNWTNATLLPTFALLVSCAANTEVHHVICFGYCATDYIRCYGFCLAEDAFHTTPGLDDESTDAAPPKK